MPRLKRLLENAGDADGAAENLFTRPLHDTAQREQRREAAAACAAPGVKMSTLLGEDDLVGDVDTGYTIAPCLPSASLDDCILAAIEDSLQDRSSVFIVPGAALVAKGIRNAMESMDLDGAAHATHLARIGVHQTTDIHVLLSILHDVQRNPTPPAQIVLGPLCLFFTSFLTANGLTTTGDGLLRIVQLACRRVRANCPHTVVTIIQPGPLFG